MGEIERHRAMRQRRTKRIRGARDEDVTAVRALLVEVKAHITAGTEDALAQSKLDTAIARLDTVAEE